MEEYAPEDEEAFRLLMRAKRYFGGRRLRYLRSKHIEKFLRYACEAPSQELIKRVKSEQGRFGNYWAQKKKEQKMVQMRLL